MTTSPPSSPVRFPGGFLWGAATASHQVEGGNVNNHYWRWEHEEHSPFAEKSGDAVDHYHRWREDLDLLAGAGFTAYRFSLEWSRIEPEEGEPSRAALDHYRRMVDGCRDRGLAPVVTLCHFSTPRWFHDDGSWLGPKAGDRFARFTELAVPILADVESVITLNEPNLAAALPVLGAMAARGEQVAGLPQPDQELTDAFLAAHRRSLEVLRGAGSPPVGLALVGQEWIAVDGGEERMVEHRAAFEDQFLHAAADCDYVGMQVYSCARIGPDGPVAPAPELLTQAHVEYRPQALGASVRRVRQVLPDTPVVVTENGVATADDEQRIAYTEGSLRGLAEAIADGADVRGYFHWSLLDNFEWFAGYAPRFGLIAVDRTTFVRTPKPSLAWLGGIARRNGFAE
ncbi:glycoside hydrolase family 1 protein [Geodermatophilus sp. TF02-6]|uniref:glycoside hydrolase family 1 protein n=1 Tax=Geodermatophilus sp. TF02-6 TaxID=2250575 RepID=UPI000DEA75D8|nr:family 1 glycosylhydrolase [Geodermatophilus sp. TF02-6]RBY75453.1 glycoside hydrolase family 1 protein [Geodermatophilus sp. TF02-6]